MRRVVVERILVDGLRTAFLKAAGSLDALPDGVWKRTGALNTWGTNALEGNTLDHSTVERLLIREEAVSGHSVPDIVETLQHEAAFRDLLRRRKVPIDLITVQELHDQVFRGLPAFRPGQWRLSNPFIGGSKYRPPRREKVVPRLDAWMKEYQRRLDSGEDPVSVGAWFHHEFEAIHPFENGNGRAGRLLLNLHLLKHDWPPVHVTPGDRRPYLRALEAGHARDFGPMRAFLEMALGRALLDLLDQVGGPRDELQDFAALESQPWNPYGAHYLSLRARQGAVLAIHSQNWSAPGEQRLRPGRPRYLTSERALRHYIQTKSRSDARRRIRPTRAARRSRP